MNIKTPKATPHIYVACLASYNNGILHGRWIDAFQDADGIRAEVRMMLAASPVPDAEEWAIHDYEGFEGVRLSEWEGFDRVAELAAFLDEHGELGAKVLEHVGGTLDEAREMLEDNYCGEYRSLADFAQEITEETTEIPPTLCHYIDYEAMARDMELGGDVFTVETGFEAVHVFWNR
jgi:antirestriction protein